MAQINGLAKFKVPLGGQDIELQQIDHVEGGMSLLRIRIREGKRFTIFDIDPDTARLWANTMLEWADTQNATTNGDGRNVAPDDKTCLARTPLPSPLPQVGEGANESLREFHVND